jgi:hypothetical protein
VASPYEKLTESLEVLRALQERGVVAVRSGDLTRTDRERLVKNGFLQAVMKGWYIPARPDEATGDSTVWYASFWGFCAAYLKERFGTNWPLPPSSPVHHMVPCFRILYPYWPAHKALLLFQRKTATADLTPTLTNPCVPTSQYQALGSNSRVLFV